MPENIRIFRYQDQDSLVLPADNNSFTVLQAWLTDIARTLDLTKRDRRKILVSCDEIFTNISSHAYAGSEKNGTAEISVSFDQGSRQLQIIFKDRGIEFDPLTAPDPDVTRPLAERQIGGLGLFMVQKLMDSVTYERQNDYNVLTLVKICGENK